VMSGAQDVVIAAGVESMSRVPMGTPTSLHAKAGIGVGPFSARIQERYGVKTFSQFVGAEMIAEKHGFSREVLDAYALESHRRAAAATEAGAFEREILQLPVEGPDGARETHRTARASATTRRSSRSGR
jgi:acetyl-CoA C-acetyltransferase